MRVIPIVAMSKTCAKTINGGLTKTTKMPCKSYSLPTVACVTGFKLAAIPGSICSSCYANKGNYKLYANNIEPAQHARLDSLADPMWVSSMVAAIGQDVYFRWHDSGDLQSVDHLRLIAQVCEATPNCKHWLPTREFGFVRDYITQYGQLPSNLTVRLSAMYPDKAVTVPKSLQGIAGVAISNVHHKGDAIGQSCIAPSQNGECRDCRACWQSDNVISYAMH